MEFIINNWYMIIATIAVGGMVGTAVYHFIKKPFDEQVRAAKKWLLWAVTEAEKELGGGTGQLKLRAVYDLFVVRFSWISKFISFETFAAWVDEALIEMRRMLESNAAVQAYVEGVKEAE